MTTKSTAPSRYDLDALALQASGRAPAMPAKPVIGITGNYVDGELRLMEPYYDSIVRAGGTPLVIPPVADADILAATLDRIDGLLLSGGADINPLYEGKEPSPRLQGINARRDLPELLTIRMAYERQLPMLGICRGIQALAMALGGSVEQDIAATATVKHSQDAPRTEPTHSVTIDDGSVLAAIMGAGRHFVNSLHHQAVAEAGPRLRVVARSADGLIEGVESCELKSIVGVQWHPEWMAEGLPLFRWLVAEASLMRDARRVHSAVLTLDSHCDSPMLFPAGADLLSRDPRLLVDLAKMHDGRLDAVVMAAYLPQPKAGEPFLAPDSNLLAPDDPSVASPAAYADRVFSRIEQFAGASDGRLAIARTTAELRRNKRHGVKSVMLAIENGLAIETDPQLVDHFASRGVVYMTLCHNGDNALCDSARGSQTHGGVSALGAEVIGRMNRAGVLVDLSHASEKTFYDALDISTVAPVCSHSSARALCDHPRNLTDDQLRALARRGGVAQTTLYHGFLCAASEATIIDAVAHLQHAIDIVGVEHVGIGTDFDGDGGVKGMASASEAINFTRQLLARRFSIDDIELIWGGNFMRMIDLAQSHKQA